MLCQYLIETSRAVEKSDDVLCYHQSLLFGFCVLRKSSMMENTISLLKL